MKMRFWLVLILLLATLISSDCVLILEEAGDDEPGLITYRIDIYREEVRTFTASWTGRVVCVVKGRDKPVKCEVV